MEHGGGMTWMSGTYDPELNLYYFGTGNPNPVHAAQSRKGDNLYTCSIVALNPDTGKMVWYYQMSPHDTHDWDNTETPVLIDATFNGQPRKLLAQAARNGYFVLLDRTNGKNLLTAPFVETLNWAKGIDAQGKPIPESRQGAEHRRHAGVAGIRRRGELVRAHVQSRHRPVLLQRDDVVRDLLSHRHRRKSAGLRRPRYKSVVASGSAGRRLQDRQGGLASRLSEFGRHTQRRC